MAFKVFCTDPHSSVNSVSLPGLGLIEIGKPVKGAVVDIQALLDEFYPGQFTVKND